MSRAARAAWRAGAHAAIHGAALTMAVPFVWMVATSLKTDAEASVPPTAGTLLPATPRWSNYAEAFRSADLGDFYRMSTAVALVTTVLAVAHNTLAGYAFAKLRFAGRRIGLWITLASMMLPAQVFFLFAYKICDWLGYLDSFQGLVVPFLASGFGVFYMRQAIAAVPDALLEAARIDGMGESDIVWTIVRPIVWPGITALAIFSFVNSWNNFFWPLIVIDSLDRKTLPLAVADLVSGQFVRSVPVMMAAATILVIPVVLVFILAQSAFVRGVASSGLKE